MSQSPIRATQLADIEAFASPKPLTSETWDWFVDTDSARGRRVAKELRLQLDLAHRQARVVHAIFVGHTGCGKSTELARLSRDLGELYYVDFCRVDDRYSLPTLDYRQLLFLCAMRLVEYAAEIEADIGAAEISVVRDWFDKHVIEEVKKRGGEVGASLESLKALFSVVSGRIYSGGETKDSAVKYIEERLDQLRYSMKIVVNAIEKAIAPRRFLLVLEGLDKVEDLQQGRTLFFDHRLQLLDLPCSVIFTFPIRLHYEPDGAMQNYPLICELPMIPVAASPPTLEQNADESEAKARLGRMTLKRLVENRIDPTLIAEEALELLIAKSGGVPRDLLSMLRTAALEAQLDGSLQIRLDEAKRAVRRLRSEYANRVSTPSLDKTIGFDDLRKALGRTSNWPQRGADKTPAFRLLLQNLCILEYNGETWHDLHPLVRDYLLLKEAEEERREAKAAFGNAQKPPAKS